MKIIVALPVLVAASLAFANEDHLLLVPTPVQFPPGAGEQISIVEVPHVTGFGADFENSCEMVASPLFAPVRSPGTKATKMDVNPVSHAGITIGCGVHGISIDYSKAGVESQKDRDLLRAMVTCLYRCMEDGGFSKPPQVPIQIVGVVENSVLHAELLACERERKGKKPAAEQGGTGQSAIRPESKPEGNQKPQPKSEGRAR
jgi:hypothetical protein